MLPAGGETENVCIVCADLVLDRNPFDSGATCRMFKGSLKRNSVSLDIACNEYLVKMTYKYKHQMEKEVKCLVKLKHSSVQHFGWDFERSMLVTEFLCKEVQLGVEKLSISTMHGNYLKMYHRPIDWISFTKPALACSTFTNTNYSLRCQSSKHFHRGW